MGWALSQQKPRPGGPDFPRIIPLFAFSEDIRKVLYLALRNLAKKWTMPIRDWKPAPGRFALEFGERFPPVH